MKIVVIGGGAGGLELASKLGKKLCKKRKPDASVTLIDQNDTHLWKPLLHEVATGALDAGVDAVSYRAQAFNCGFDFQRGKVVNINRERKVVELGRWLDEQGNVILQTRYIQYDYVVFALGSITNDFAIQGVSEHCIFLDKPSQAMKFHKVLLASLLSLDEKLKSDPSQTFTVSIVGAGATGVELSAELYHAVDVLSVYGLSRLTSKHLCVNLIESGPNILPALPERVQANVLSELNAMGVNVMVNTKIVKASEKGYITEDKSIIYSDQMVWAAGVKVADFMSDIVGLETNRINQLIVTPTLQSMTDQSVFALGDCACLPLNQEISTAVDQPKKYVPPTAQAAHQMASVVYKNLVQISKNKKHKRALGPHLLKAFKYKDYGSLVSLSHYSTVGSLMGGVNRGSMMIEGRLARLMYVSLYRMHQLALFGWFKMSLIAISSRINKVIRPRLKLH